MTGAVDPDGLCGLNVDWRQPIEPIRKDYLGNPVKDYALDEVEADEVARYLEAERAERERQKQEERQQAIDARQDWLDKLADFTAGAGDIMSFGIGYLLREHVFGMKMTEYDSSAYYWGEWAGFAADLLAGGITGGIKTGVRKAGQEALETLAEQALKNADELTTAAKGAADDLLESGAKQAPQPSKPQPNSGGGGVCPPPSKILSKGERLKIFNQRLIDAPAAKNADEAFELLGRTMDDVEDAFSGIAKVDNPGLKYQGRMYPPRPDFTTRLPNGGLEAITKGNIIRIDPNGAIRIYARNADGSLGKLLLEKLGGG